MGRFADLSRTFLLVRLVRADFANLKEPLKSMRLVSDETWLSRMKLLLDMVNHVRIPGGFTRVAPPQ